MTLRDARWFVKELELRWGERPQSDVYDITANIPIFREQG